MYRYFLYKASYYMLSIEHTWCGSALVQNCIICRSPSITEHDLRSNNDNEVSIVLQKELLRIELQVG